MAISKASAPPRRPARVQSRHFDYGLDFGQIDFAQQPELYRVGRGEQGVLLVQPYKSLLLPHWRFATPELAQVSSTTLLQMFADFLDAEDFVGADMARKFLQMGYTRARRYANHRGGRKYVGPVPDDKKGLSGAHGRPERPRDAEDPVKAESARIFYAAWQQAEADPRYAQRKTAWKAQHG